MGELGLHVTGKELLSQINSKWLRYTNKFNSTFFNKHYLVDLLWTHTESNSYRHVLALCIVITLEHLRFSLSSFITICWTIPNFPQILKQSKTFPKSYTSKKEETFFKKKLFLQKEKSKKIFLQKQLTTLHIYGTRSKSFWWKLL